MAISLHPATFLIGALWVAGVRPAHPALTPRGASTPVQVSLSPREAPRPPHSPPATRAPLECRMTPKGAEYRGHVSMTSSRRSCQEWSAHAPHVHNFRDASLFPDSNLTFTRGRCRNPGGVRAQPWCFTRDPHVVWEYCSVPMCGCRQTRGGHTYTGKISVTTGGLPCQRWDRQYPHSHRYQNASAFLGAGELGEAANYCRNPDPWETGGPWCYTLHRTTRWQYCNVPFCECAVSAAGQEYGGRISRTRSGHVCQRWDAQTPHAHRYTRHCRFPEDGVGAAANHCRNPDPAAAPHGPWCFTTDPHVRWEYCRVPPCDGANFSTSDQEAVLAHAYTTVVETQNVDKAMRPAPVTEYVFMTVYAISAVILFLTLLMAVVVLRSVTLRVQTGLDDPVTAPPGESFHAAFVKDKSSDFSSDGSYALDKERYLVIHTSPKCDRNQQHCGTAECAPKTRDSSSHQGALRSPNTRDRHAFAHKPNVYKMEPTLGSQSDGALNTTWYSETGEISPDFVSEKDTPAVCGVHIYENISDAEVDCAKYC